MPDDTRDLIIGLAATFKEHDRQDTQRWDEMSQRFENVFRYIKESNDKQNNKIDAVSAQISNLNIESAVTKGRSALMKSMIAGALALIAAVSGFAGGKLGH